MLTATDLAFMQNTQELAMPGTVVIERYTTTSNGMGGSREAWNAVGTVIGRIYPRTSRSGDEAVGGAQVQSTMMWYGTLPSETDVIEKDRLLYSNRTWEVIRVNNDEMWQTATRCELQSMNEERRT